MYLNNLNWAAKHVLHQVNEVIKALILAILVSNRAGSSPTLVN